MLLLLLTGVLATLTQVDATAMCTGPCVPINSYHRINTTDEENNENNAYIVTRLWTINATSELTDLEVIDEFETGFGPIVTSLTGFIQYTAAQTGNTSTVFFMNIFDTQANAHVAQEAAKNFVGRNAKLGNDAIIPNQFHELTVAAYITPPQDDPGNNDSSDPATCKQDSYAGKFLSTRLYESVESLSVETTQNLTLEANAEGSVSTQPGFFSYLGSDTEDADASNSEGGYIQFFYTVFETDEQSENATQTGTSSASNSSGGTFTQIESTSGRIIFDLICTHDYHHRQSISAMGDNGSLNDIGGAFLDDTYSGSPARAATATALTMTGLLGTGLLLLVASLLP